MAAVRNHSALEPMRRSLCWGSSVMSRRIAGLLSRSRSIRRPARQRPCGRWFDPRVGSCRMTEFPKFHCSSGDLMGEQGGLMAGKRGLIMGVANERSIAWGIARAVAAQGAELAFTYQGDALGKRVTPLAQSIGVDFVIPCDVTDDVSIDSVFAAITERWGRLDFVVHAIAFSDKDELKGKYVNTTRKNFTLTLDVSCYSFTAVSQRAARLMPDGGSLLTLTYYGAERVMPHYNVMGVAKAALEASVRYMAADLGGQNIRVNAIS